MNALWQIIELSAIKFSHSSFNKWIVGIWWLASAWEIEISQVYAYKIPLVGVFWRARFRRDFFKQIVIYVSFRKGNKIEISRMDEVKGWEKLDKVSRWKMGDQGDFRSQEHYRLEPKWGQIWGQDSLGSKSVYTVLVSYCHCNKWPYMEFLKTTQIYYLTFWRSEVQNRSHCVSKAVILSGGSRGESIFFFFLFFFFQCLEASEIPWIMAPSIFKASSDLLNLPQSTALWLWPPAFLFLLQGPCDNIILTWITE